MENHKQELENKYKIGKIGIFGSYAKDTQNEDSDLDILVEFNEDIDLLEYMDVEDYLKIYWVLK